MMVALETYLWETLAMKPQQLAQLLNIAPNTLRRWAGKEYSEFLSPNAQGINGAHRSFSDQDARILAWIALMKAENTSTENVMLALQSAHANNWKNLPPLPGGFANDEPIAVVPREAAEERFRALQERYETQLQAVIKERDEIKAQLETVRREAEVARREATEAIQAFQRETSETIKTIQSGHAEVLSKAQHEAEEATRALQQRINELTAKEAELRGRQEQYTIAGRHWSALTLAAMALLAGAALMLIALIVATQLAK